jgi:hypothetical protein
MIPKRFRLILLLSLLLPAFACQLLTESNQEAGSTGRLLFRDDFTDPNSGWNRVTTSQGQTDYADGVYRIFVNEPTLDIWSMPGKDYKDVRIEVDALKVGGERDNRFGIICRANRPDSFYTFIVSSDGYCRIGKIQGRDCRLLGMDALQPSQSILKGSPSTTCAPTVLATCSPCT